MNLKLILKLIFVLPFVPFLFLEHAIRWCVAKEHPHYDWVDYYYIPVLVRYLFNKIFS